MPLFTSPREKRLWLYAFLVMFAIFSILAFGRPFQEMLRDQNIQAVFFLSGMILTGATIIVHGLKVKPSKTEIAIWFGLSAVYIMFVFRLGAPERSHLIEYSVLAIFIHKALNERVNQEKKWPLTAIIALLLTALIGTLDEWIQLFLPERVFDPEDILFNALSALTAIGVSLAIQWTRKKFGKKNELN